MNEDFRQNHNEDFRQNHNDDFSANHFGGDCGRNDNCCDRPSNWDCCEDKTDFDIWTLIPIVIIILCLCSCGGDGIGGLFGGASDGCGGGNMWIWIIAIVVIFCFCGKDDKHGGFLGGLF